MRPIGGQAASGDLRIKYFYLPLLGMHATLPHYRCMLQVGRRQDWALNVGTSQDHHTRPSSELHAEAALHLSSTRSQPEGNPVSHTSCEACLMMHVSILKTCRRWFCDFRGICFYTSDEGKVLPSVFSLLPLELNASCPCAQRLG